MEKHKIKISKRQKDFCICDYLLEIPKYKQKIFKQL